MLTRVAVTPDEAAKSLIEWTEKLDMSKTGEYWAPRGPSKHHLKLPDCELVLTWGRGYWDC